MERVLTWRASSRNKLPLDMQTEPVAQAVSDAIERFLGMVDPDDVHLSSQVDTRIPVQHDAHAIHVVLLNLLTNACKYTEADKRIAVQVSDANEGVVIDVRDNGGGIV